MSKLLITGRQPLTGDVNISGSKNSSVAIIPAALLGEGTTVLENVPAIRDVQVFAQIIRALGVDVSLEHNVMTISPNGFSTYVTD